MHLLEDSKRTRAIYRELIEASDTASVYHTLEWLDAFRGLLSELTFIVPFADAMIPFVCKGRGALRRAYSLPFDTYGGPVAAVSNGPVTFERVVEKLGGASARVVDFCSRVKPANGDDVARGAATHVVDLSGGYDSVVDRYSESNRRLIRQATERGVHVDVIRDVVEVAAFHVLHRKTVRKYGVLPLPLRFFEAVYRNMVPKGMAVFYLARYNDHVVGGNLILRFRDESYDWMWVYDERYLSRRPTNALIDRAVRDEAERGAATLNLGASPDERLGSVRFKRGFGAQPRSYRIFSQTGRYHAAARRFRDTARRFRQGFAS